VAFTCKASARLCPDHKTAAASCICKQHRWDVSVHLMQLEIQLEDPMFIQRSMRLVMVSKRYENNLYPMHAPVLAWRLPGHA
jgi:hypothetical protein